MWYVLLFIIPGLRANSADFPLKLLVFTCTFPTLPRFDATLLEVKFILPMHGPLNHSIEEVKISIAIFSLHGS